MQSCLPSGRRPQHQPGGSQALQTGCSKSSWQSSWRSHGPVQRGVHQLDGQRQPLPSWPSLQHSWQQPTCRRPQPAECGYWTPAGAWLSCRGHDSLHVVDCGTRVSDVVLELALGASSTVKQGLALLHLPRQGSGLALADADLLNDLGTRAGLILKGLDGLTELVLVALDRLQTFGVDLVGMVQTNLQLIDFTLQLLLDTESLALGPLLSLNRGSKGIHCTGMILPGVVELLLLLSHTAVDLLPDLSQLQLRP